MLVSCRVTGPRRDPDISGDGVNINIALAAAFYLISAGAGLHNQDYTNSSPAQAAAAASSQARGSSNHSVITAAVCRASLALAARLARPSLGCTL